MSRFYNNCVDEASLTTLCPICLDSFQGAKGVRVRRADPKQKIKDVCTYCQIRYGFDYYEVNRPFSSCARSLEPPRASFSDSYSLPIRNFFRSGSRFLRPSWFWQIHERAA